MEVFLEQIYRDRLCARVKGSQAWWLCFTVQVSLLTAEKEQNSRCVTHSPYSYD